jgi:hypothetical protein
MSFTLWHSMMIPSAKFGETFRAQYHRRTRRLLYPSPPCLPLVMIDGCVALTLLPALTRANEADKGNSNQPRTSPSQLIHLDVHRTLLRYGLSTTPQSLMTRCTKKRWTASMDSYKPFDLTSRFGNYRHHFTQSLRCKVSLAHS